MAVVWTILNPAGAVTLNGGVVLSGVALAGELAVEGDAPLGAGAFRSHALAKANYSPDPIFGLPLPAAVPDVPAEVLNPRNTWKDGAAYDAQAKKLAKLFRENDAKFEMPEAVRAAGPRG